MNKLTVKDGCMVIACIVLVCLIAYCGFMNLTNGELYGGF